MSGLDDPRVLFAAERTLLAWNRTSISLIAFGFLVERSGLLLDEVQIPANASQALMTFYIGSAFIALGVYAALNACYQHRAVLRSLKPNEYPPGYSAHGGVAINVVVAVLGLGLVAVLYASRA